MNLDPELLKNIQALINEATTPENHLIGTKFENYVRENLFHKSNYSLLEKTPDYQANKTDFIESSLKPDFKFRDIKTNKEFFVEAKFRSKMLNNKINWSNFKQIERYRSYEVQAPVFILLGLGNNPIEPEFVTLIPLQYAKFEGIFSWYAKKFEIAPSSLVTSEVLWDRKFNGLE